MTMSQSSLTQSDHNPTQSHPILDGPGNTNLHQWALCYVNEVDRNTSYARQCVRALMQDVDTPNTQLRHLQHELVTANENLAVAKADTKNKEDTALKLEAQIAALNLELTKRDGSDRQLLNEQATCEGLRSELDTERLLLASATSKLTSERHGKQALQHVVDALKLGLEIKDSELRAQRESSKELEMRIVGLEKLLTEVCADAVKDADAKSMQAQDLRFKISLAFGASARDYVSPMDFCFDLTAPMKGTATVATEVAASQDVRAPCSPSEEGEIMEYSPHLEVRAANCTSDNKLPPAQISSQCRWPASTSPSEVSARSDTFIVLRTSHALIIYTQ